MARPSACCESASTYQGACALRAARPRRRQDGAQDERFEVGTVRRRLTSLHSVLLDELLQIARLSKRFFGSAFQRPYVADRKSTRLNSSHSQISYAVFCLKKKKHQNKTH